ncbi:MAG TPA: enoyl-CoA hydratase/isomerase family protein [Chloroflexota bacterium]|jgi:enoyl-CoA hydratase/carnithine racemase|nr:enoyl-CoA hydratase/isomerase family protein [Chloroflexota bacterium]
MTFSTITYEKCELIGRITLSRPDVLNAYSVQMRDELYEVLQAVRDDDEVRVLIIRGAGRAFCAGADLREFGTAPSPVAARHIRFARDVWGQLHSLFRPTIMQLHGFVFGSGLELALFGTFRIAAEGTQFRLPEVQLGMVPAAGGTQTLPRVVSVSAALELLLTGRQFETAEALRLGILTRVVPPDRLEPEVNGLAAELAALNPTLVAAVIRAVRDGSDLPMRQALDLERRLASSIQAHRSTDGAA